MLLIKFILLAVGLTYIVTQSSIFMLLRMYIHSRSAFLGTLIYCPACTGFWVGMFLGLLKVWPYTNGLFPALEAAIASCGLCATWAAVCLNTSSWDTEQANAETEKEGRHD